MSAAAVATANPYVMLAFAGVSAYAQLKQGQAQATQFKAQAQQAKLEGRAKAIAYKQQGADILTRLNEHLASSTARVAASGIDALSGSALSLSNYAISQGSLEYSTARDNQTIAEDMGIYHSKIAKSAASNARTSSLLSAGATLGMGYMGYRQAGGKSLLPSFGTGAGLPASQGGGVIGVPLNVNSTGSLA